VYRGDHTCCDFYLTVLPANTDAAVFSIDGSFTASVSIMGKDPKVQPGAVDVARWIISLEHNLTLCHRLEKHVSNINVTISLSAELPC